MSKLKCDATNKQKDDESDSDEIEQFFQDNLCPKNEFVDNFDVCSQKSSGHKAVKFDRNVYLHWDYNLSKKSFSSEWVRLEMSLYCVDLMWNDLKGIMAIIHVLL
jgi:hypothetical protein